MFVNFAVPHSPLSLGLYYAFLLCGTNAVAAPLLYIAASAAEADLIYTATAAFAGVFLAAVTFIYRRTGRRLKAEAAVYFAIAVTPYIVFAAPPPLGQNLNTYLIKGVAAAVAGLYCVFAYKSVYALFFRLMRCRLREDEYLSLGVTFAVIGAGVYSALGGGAYICLSAMGIIFFTRLLKSPSALIISVAFAVAPCAVTLSAEPLTAYICGALAALVFANAGRFAPSVAVAPLCAAYMYFKGVFGCPPPLIAVYALILFLCCALPALPKEKTLKNLRLRLECRQVLDGTQAERSRKRTAEKLYKLSELFREIERSFLSLDESVDDAAARERILIQLKEGLCKGCERQKRCKNTAVYGGFKRLIDAGCIKGKVNLIDLPSEITALCMYPSEVMLKLNALLYEYRKYMAETENARSGRRLLADQAHGVAEVMKGYATELAKRPSDYSEEEEFIKKALAVRGISCPEAQINDLYGEIAVVICGKFDINALTSTIGTALGTRYSLKEKIAYSEDKICLVFCQPPPLDAAFGVAYAIKKGEKVSGDTHSVIKINERSFLMALSDGMGSGVYAKKVSEAAISLIEAFYRAETPPDTVLKTINKLLSFNRDERFACIDIAAVDLETGRADFVKIGSPAGIIMREDGIKIMESASLPLGILDNLKPTVCTETLKSGDIIVFMSDGITSSFPSSTELYEFLQTFKPLNPQNLADAILAGALERTGRVAADDMTVVCVRIFEH